MVFSLMKISPRSPPARSFSKSSIVREERVVRAAGNYRGTPSTEEGFLSVVKCKDGLEEMITDELGDGCQQLRT